MTGESNGCPDYGAMHNFSSRHTSHPSVDHTTVDVPEDHKPTRSPADPQTPMSLLRKLSNKAEEEMAESSTFFCFVCCENMEESCRYQLEGCQNDSHTLCRDCTAGWIQSKITDGEVMRLPCPMMADASCAGFASEQDVTQLCSEDIIRRFERFQTLGGEEGAEYRQCPRCAVLNKGSLAFQALSGFKPLVKCSACEYEYCFFHSDAHPGSSCLSFAVAQRRTELIEAQDPNYVQESSRPCPKCAAPSYKYAGCNHMSCQECKRRFGEATEWCWLCSEDMGGLNNVTDHYGSGKCSGAQFAPERQWAAETGSLRWPLRLLRGAYAVAGVAVWSFWLHFLWTHVHTPDLGFELPWFMPWYAAMLLLCCCCCAGAACGVTSGVAAAGHILICLCGCTSFLCLLVLVLPPFTTCIVGFFLFVVAWELLVAAACILMLLPFALLLCVVRYAGGYDSHSRLQRLENTVEYLLSFERGAKALLLFPMQVIPYTITVLRRGRLIERHFTTFSLAIDRASDCMVQCLLSCFVGRHRSTDDHEGESLLQSAPQEPSNIPCPQCTFENTPESTECEMCEAVL